MGSFEPTNTITAEQVVAFFMNADYAEAATVAQYVAGIIKVRGDMPMTEPAPKPRATRKDKGKPRKKEGTEATT